MKKILFILIFVEFILISKIEHDVTVELKGSYVTPRTNQGLNYDSRLGTQNFEGLIDLGLGFEFVPDDIDFFKFKTDLSFLIDSNNKKELRDRDLSGGMGGVNVPMAGFVSTPFRLGNSAQNLTNFRFDIDNFYMSFSADSFNFDIGRKKLSFGNSLLFNVTNYIDMNGGIFNSSAYWIAESSYSVSNTKFSFAYLPGYFFDPELEYLENDWYPYAKPLEHRLQEQILYFAVNNFIYPVEFNINFFLKERDPYSAKFYDFAVSGDLLYNVSTEVALKLSGIFGRGFSDGFRYVENSNPVLFKGIDKEHFHGRASVGLFWVVNGFIELNLDYYFNSTALNLDEQKDIEKLLKRNDVNSNTISPLLNSYSPFLQHNLFMQFRFVLSDWDMEIKPLIIFSLTDGTFYQSTLFQYFLDDNVTLLFEYDWFQDYGFGGAFSTVNKHFELFLGVKYEF